MAKSKKGITDRVKDALSGADKTPESATPDPPASSASSASVSAAPPPKPEPPKNDGSLEFKVKLSGLGPSWMDLEKEAACARLGVMIRHGGPGVEVS